jgi:hypothetical protein
MAGVHGAENLLTSWTESKEKERGWGWGKKKRMRQERLRPPVTQRPPRRLCLIKVQPPPNSARVETQPLHTGLRGTVRI